MTAVQLDVIPALILWLLLPAWILAGFLDWLCHRRSQIAVHCGPWESLMHLLLLAQAGAALILGMLFEINEVVLALLLLCFVLHEITGYADIRFAHARRDISPAEQRIHDYMTAMPVTALFLVAILHWPAARSIALDPASILAAPLRLKSPPLPVPQVLGIFAGVFLFSLLPYVEELYRGIRALKTRNR